MNNKGLLVIDMQKDLCYNPKRKEKIMQMLPPLKMAIDFFSRNHYPIFYISFALKENDPQFKRFGDRYCIEGSEGAEIIDELYPLRGQIIFKQKHSAFFETDLDTLLKKEGIGEIYLTGMQTQICIMTTAADASFRGYQPIVIQECVLSTSENKKKLALKWIEDYVGIVDTLSKVINQDENER
ncbi:MAG: cysteine hydrolase [Lewinellaceae bacterium]|nr:cysteine hydrolase [Lewinellaceae bacterium]